ncbi:MAG: hypothetical protein ACUVRZ_03445 [Desulfobacca sp.]|uniref:hypothetical protein n=1 Tax=Desulfobacca sp. TaxID=2067990 RepID=UPI00404A48D2
MAPSSFSSDASAPATYQNWIIEDSWEGTIYLIARLCRSWQGCCGSYKLLEGADGQYYFWAVVPANDGIGVRQRLVRFQDQETMAAALDLTAWGGWDSQMTATPYH